MFYEMDRAIFTEQIERINISLDGKTVRSTEKMKDYEKPLHIVRAQICE
jgi:hypothetical protein